MHKTLVLFLLLTASVCFGQTTAIVDQNFEQALIDLNLDNVIDGKVLTANIKDVTTLEVQGKNISNLTGIEGFTKLEKLDIGFIDITKRNFVTNLDLSNNINLKWLNCSYNELSNINLSKNTALTVLMLENNKLTSLDISTNTLLYTLFCINNNITSINVSKNTSLTSLTLSQNRLTSLDLSQNVDLKDLACNNNNLSSLIVSKNTVLEHLNVHGNHLTVLDVSNNPNLLVLNCFNNQLAKLDISNNSNLFNFWCNDNQLTNLNLKNGQNAKLTSFDFRSNSNLNCIQVDNKAFSDANWATFKDLAANFSQNCSTTPVASEAPIVTAEGDQIYCPQSSIKIVTDFNIVPGTSETGAQAIYVQISSGYSSGFDTLNLLNTSAHPDITQSFDPVTGKLTLSNPSGADILYADLVKAIKDVVFTNSSPTASGSRTFSISIGQANYLPSTQHYYQFISSVGITWSDAKAAAESSSNKYYGLQGYLATLLSADEAKLSGEQASGTGWIGGSDAETEGVWKWVTGPEAGTAMSYTFWNTGEPNNQGDEDYAHITQPGIGIKGSWNDLSNTGSLTPGDAYQPKGYVIEYGGMPGEAPLQIAASTKITIPLVTPSANPNSVCDSGTFTFNATVTGGGTIGWYDKATGGNLLGTGNTFTTSPLNSTKTYYVSVLNCNSNRKPVIATVNQTPSNPVAEKNQYTNCGPGAVAIKATSNIGTIKWYTTATDGSSIYEGPTFTPTVSITTTFYAEASNGTCRNTQRTPVEIVIYTPPAVVDETLTLCPSQTLTLDAGISGMAYEWSTGANTQTIDNVTKGGTYTVKVSNPAENNCSSVKTIIVEEHEAPQIDRINVEGTRAIIYLKKEQDYFEYSVDGAYFQNSNIFYDLPAGLHTATVKDKSDCDTKAYANFVVLVFPAFFTPNNDTYNDFWEVKGMENYPQAEVTIFDRYGKLVAQLTASKMSWDGTLDKTPLPASDYWYALKVDDMQPVLRGHFTLKR